ncbi:MAG: hypothetical protein ABI068_04420, partial [Ktedonobacterales bacterium]
MRPLPELPQGENNIYQLLKLYMGEQSGSGKAQVVGMGNRGNRYRQQGYHNYQGSQEYGSELDAPTLLGGTAPLAGSSSSAAPPPSHAPPYYPSYPSYPNYPNYPSGRPPQWPGPQAPRPPAYPPYSAQPADADYPTVQAPRHRHVAPAPLPPHAAPRPPQPVYRTPDHQPRAAYRTHGRSLPQLPVAHILLILGVAAMALALMQPWGIDAQGSPIYVKTFTSAALSAQGLDAGALAFQTAEYLLGAVAILAAA